MALSSLPSRGTIVRSASDIVRRAAIAPAIALAIAVCAVSAPANAQRATAVGFAPAHQVRSYVPAPDSVASGSSHAVGIGALAGAILVGSYGYALGAANCDGSGGTRHGCIRQGLIGGTLIGAGIGAIMGHIIQLGEERDARRARAVADTSGTAR